MVNFPAALPFIPDSFSCPDYCFSVRPAEDSSVGIGWVSGGLGLERSESTDGIMVKEVRGFVGKGDGGVRGILGKFQCQLIVGGLGLERTRR